MADAPREYRDELMRLATVAAHQLKSPLSSIQTVLDLMMGGFVGPITPKQRDLLERASMSVGRGTTLVSDLFRLRFLDTLTREKMVPVDLGAVFRTAVDRVREAADKGGVELEGRVEADEDHGWVLGDPAILAEVLHVLLENAVKYTPTGGRVQARLYAIPGVSDEEGLEGWPDLCVEVMDTGIGIPADAYASLFNEFYRAPNARAASKEGTGLGLAFAHRATAVLGGRLTLEPSPAGGVLARAVLPCTVPDPTRVAPARTTVAPRRRVVVVGGVTAGSKTAARISRLDPTTEVTVVEKGRFLSYAGCGLPYYISGTVKDQRELLSSPVGDVRDAAYFHNVKNVRTLDLTEAIHIDREKRVVKVRRLVDGRESLLPYDHLVLATGALACTASLESRRMEGIWSLHGVEDAEAIRSSLRMSSAKEVVIVGAGLLGSQVTEAVAGRGSRVSLVESGPQILGFVDPELAAHARRHVESRGVRVFTDATVEGFVGNEPPRAPGEEASRPLGSEGGRPRVMAVRLTDGRQLPCDFAILATGVCPNVDLARAAGLELGSTGAIRVDAHLRTSDPSIWAVGDCVEDQHLITGQPVWAPSGSKAARQGRVVANNLCGLEERFLGVVGTWIVKLFDFTVATTGLGEAQARAAGFDPVCALVPGFDRAHYLPTASNIVLKLVADRASRRILGLQAVGPGEVAKRIDVVATALAAGLTVDALALLDLAYAPAFSLAYDPVQTASNVIRNKLDGLFQGISAAALKERLMHRNAEDEGPFLVDVRLPSEYGQERLPNSMHLPLGNLRGRIHELPRDRDIVLIGRIGLRSYEAARVLAQSGFQRVHVLDGGLDGWPYELEVV